MGPGMSGLGWARLDWAGLDWAGPSRLTSCKSPRSGLRRVPYRAQGVVRVITARLWVHMRDLVAWNAGVWHVHMHIGDPRGRWLGLFGVWLGVEAFGG